MSDAGDPTLPAWLSVAATGNRMVYDSTGYLTWAPNNLLTYSEQFDNAAWSRAGGVTVSPNTDIAPDGTQTADTISSTSNEITQSFSVANGSYKNSLYIKKTVGATVYPMLAMNSYAVGTQVILNTNTGVATTRDNGTAPANLTVSSVGNYWLISYDGTVSSGQFIYKIYPAASTNGVNYSAGLTNSIVVWGAQVERVTYQTAPRAYIPTTSAARFLPRFDVDPATLAARGLLIEGAGTNLQIYSEQLGDASWTKTSTSVTDNSTIAPSGSLTADTITASSAGANREIGSSLISLTSGSNYAISWYVKNGSTGWCYFGLSDYVANYLAYYVNLTTGQVGSAFSGGSGLSIVGSPTAIDVGNGWWRVQMTVSCTATRAYRQVVGIAAGNNNATVANGATLIAWGAQLETGTIATSYIPTTTASVNRSAETISAALYTTNPSILQYRPIPAGTRARKIIDPFSGISSETQEWIESGAVYPMGTGSAYLNTKLTVDGPY